MPSLVLRWAFLLSNALNLNRIKKKNKNKIDFSQLIYRFLRCEQRIFIKNRFLGNAVFFWIEFSLTVDLKTKKKIARLFYFPRKRIFRLPHHQAIFFFKFVHGWNCKFLFFSWKFPSFFPRLVSYEICLSLSTVHIYYQDYETVTVVTLLHNGYVKLRNPKTRSPI